MRGKDIEGAENQLDTVARGCQPKSRSLSFLLDPVAAYMDKFFNTGYFSIADVFPIVWVDQILCKGKQGGSYSQDTSNRLISESHHRQ
jgi:hypothetical protein